MLVDSIYLHDFIDQIGAGLKGKVLRLDEGIVTVEQKIFDLVCINIEPVLMTKVGNTHNHDGQRLRRVRSTRALAV